MEMVDYCLLTKKLLTQFEKVKVVHPPSIHKTCASIAAKMSIDQLSVLDLKYLLYIQFSAYPL